MESREDAKKADMVVAPPTAGEAGKQAGGGGGGVVESKIPYLLRVRSISFA